MEVNFILHYKTHTTKVSQGWRYIDILEVKVLVLACQYLNNPTFLVRLYNVYNSISRKPFIYRVDFLVSQKKYY